VILVDGTPIGNGDSFTVILWVVVNENAADSKVFLNLPTGGYTTAAQAQADSSGKNVYTIPQFFHGTALLVLALTIQRSGGGGTWSSIQEIDLRGIPGVTLGGSGGQPSGVSDHGALSGLTDDDHTQYILEDGTRAFSGDQSMGSNKITNLGAPTANTDAARLQDVLNQSGGFYGITWNDGTNVHQTDRLHFNSNDFYLSGTYPKVNIKGLPTHVNLCAVGNRHVQKLTDGTVSLSLVRTGSASAQVAYQDEATNAGSGWWERKIISPLFNAILIDYSDNVSKVNWRNTASTTDFQFSGASDANMLYLDSDTDKVGIGTDTPTAKLDVDGVIKSSGKSSQMIADGFYGGFGDFDRTLRTTHHQAYRHELNGNTKDLTIDWSLGNVFFLPIRRPMTIHKPSNLPPTDAQTIQLITQNDGFYSFTWSRGFLFPGGGQIDATQDIGAVDMWSMVWEPGLDRVLVAKAADFFYS
jgi:hypothetical protein